MINTSQLITGKNLPSPYMFPILQQPMQEFFVFLFIILIVSFFTIYGMDILMKLKRYTYIQSDDKILLSKLRFTKFNYFVIKRIIFFTASFIFIFSIHLKDLKINGTINLIPFIIEIILYDIFLNINFNIFWRKDLKKIKQEKNIISQNSISEIVSELKKELNNSVYTYTTTNTLNNCNRIDINTMWDKYDVLKQENTFKFLNSIDNTLDVKEINK